LIPNLTCVLCLEAEPSAREFECTCCRRLRKHEYLETQGALVPSYVAIGNEY